MEGVREGEGLPQHCDFLAMKSNFADSSAQAKLKAASTCSACDG